MTDAQLKNKYLLMVEHLNHASKIAMDLEKYLGPVQGPAPKRGSVAKMRRAEIAAYVAAKQKRRLGKYLNQQ